MDAYDLFIGERLQYQQILQPLLVEKKNPRMTKEECDLVEGKVSIEEYYDVLKARSEDRRAISKVLDSIKTIEPTFGKPYFKLEMDDSELEHIQRELDEN